MTALTADQHSAIISYAEAKGKEAHSVRLSEVLADGGVDKWKVAADKQQRQTRVFPVLQKRAPSVCSYKEMQGYI